MFYMNLLRDQRCHPRVPVGTLCTELYGNLERQSLVLDVSDTGLRLQRPVAHTHGTNRIVQLEFDVPGVDEIIWAKGLVCFDQFWSMPAGPAALERSRLVHLSGVQILAAAQRHLRLLRDFVMDSWMRGVEPIRPGRLFAPAIL